MRYSIMLILLSLLTACQISSKKEQENGVSENDTCVAITPEKVTSSQSSQEEDSAIIKRYRTFNLFTMQGSGICENDSCVIVTQKKDTIVVETLLPKKYRFTFIKTDNYWYSCVLLNMNTNISIVYKEIPQPPRPERYDMFILNNTIYQYEQMFTADGSMLSLKITKPNLVESIWVGVDSIPTTDRQIIYSKILDIMDRKDEFDHMSTSYDLIRDGSSLRKVSRRTGETVTFTFPELQILGLTGEFDK